MQKAGVRGTKEQIQAAHGKRVKQLVSRRGFFSRPRLRRFTVDHPSKTTFFGVPL
jgi:hypothetical protein